MLPEHSGQQIAVHAPTALAGPLSMNLPFEVRWASSEEDLRAAQRLRFQVFAQELGAQLAPHSGAGLDIDRFDAYCDHLIVRAAGPGDEQPGLLLGTYRVLPPAAAVRAGGFYSDTEFDLSPLRHLRGHAVELGRCCVHPAWRTGGVILALWAALGQYMLRHRLDTMIGCASIGMHDGGQSASDVWHHLRHDYLVGPQWQVRPRTPLPLAQDRSAASDRRARFDVQTPPLIKGYLRCGSRLLGPPAMDRAFNTADLPIMLRLDGLAPRYRKHFLGEH